jgi:hypothetical protein
MHGRCPIARESVQRAPICAGTAATYSDNYVHRRQQCVFAYCAGTRDSYGDADAVKDERAEHCSIPGDR